MQGSSITVHTIGHSRHALDHFIALLLRHQIATLVDVRSHPTSRLAPQFRKDPLARALAAAGIHHQWSGRALGGRPEGAEFYRPDGSLDGAARARAPELQAGIEALLALAAVSPTALMCAEEDPARCHRHRLLAPELLRRGATVLHIRGDGRLEPDSGAPGRPGQLPLFDDP